MTELDPHPDTGHFATVEDLHGLDENDDEWLGGLRRAGLPVVTRPAAPPAPSPGLAHLLAEATPTASAGLVELVAESVAPATRAAYERDWADFELFCRTQGLDDPFDATALMVGEYVNDLVRDRKAISTIRRRLAAIRYCFTLAGRPSPTGHPLVTTAVAGATRLLGTAKVQAAPLRLAELRRILTALPILAPNRPTMRRDQTMIAVGWAGALRAGELVGLDVDDVTTAGDPNDGDGGVILRLRSTKGAPGGVQHVAIPYSAQWGTCPARRLLAWLRPLRAGPLFRHLDRHGQLHGRLAPRCVTDIVRRAVTDCLHVDGGPYTSHSLRAGFVTEARAHDVPDDLIARHTRHARPGQRRGGILHTYDRPSDLFERPALAAEWW